MPEDDAFAVSPSPAVTVGDRDTSGWSIRDPRTRLRQPEVEHLDRAVRRDLDVGRLEIAMDDALLVRGVERVRDLPRDRQRLVERQRPLRHAIGERLAFDQFQHQRVDAVAVFDAVNRGDVRMVQRGEQPGLALEAGETVGIGRE